MLISLAGRLWERGRGGGSADGGHPPCACHRRPRPASRPCVLITGVPLVMNGGDTIKIHFFEVSAAEGWHVNARALSSPDTE